MRFISTRSQSDPVSLSSAMQTSLADDGGLYVPEAFPYIDLTRLTELSFQDFSAQVLNLFFSGDVLQDHLSEICREAFNFPIPLRSLPDKNYLLELFHGPTCAFKDVGARFLASCLTRVAELEHKHLTLLVATSGDTGGAVASAFFKKEGIKVVILYPKGGVSSLQERQLTCWGENVTTLRVDGSFDDCQNLVKAAFSKKDWQKKYFLSSANSINIMRLLPQSLYYAYWSLNFLADQQRESNFVVPTGNLGNAVAALWAKEMGFPIRRVFFSLNANDTVRRYLQNGKVEPQASRPTLANAMDVGKPSNLERLAHLYQNDVKEIKKVSLAVSVSDEEIQRAITWAEKNWSQVICPHTATACHLVQSLGAQGQSWIVVATAHAAKFRDIVEPLVTTPFETPQQLAQLLKSPQWMKDISPDLEALEPYLKV